MKESCLICGPVSNDKRFAGVEHRDDIKSSIICTLMARNEVVGVLCVARNKSDKPFNNTDKRYIINGDELIIQSSLKSDVILSISQILDENKYVVNGVFILRICDIDLFLKSTCSSSKS